MTPENEEIVSRILSGDRRTIARAITLVENSTPPVREIMRALLPHTGKAHIIGVTGPPGTGKSTLTNQLIKHYRASSRKIGVVCVDPTSSLSGGAVLGDRIRLPAAYGDPGVFVRSMATRGNLGGLARTTNDVLRLLDAAGMEILIVETVGVGQDELDIARTAQTTLLVQVPGLGDDIQAIKAGILEIADILVINKADLPGADRVQNELQTMLNLGPKEGYRGWKPPICRTTALKGEGITLLGGEIERHYAHLQTTGQLVNRQRELLREEVINGVRDLMAKRARQALSPEGKFATLLDQLVDRELDVARAIELLTE